MRAACEDVNTFYCGQRRRRSCWLSQNINLIECFKNQYFLFVGFVLRRVQQNKTSFFCFQQTSFT